MPSTQVEILVFLFGTTAVVLLMICTIIFLIYIHQKRQALNQQRIDDMKISHQKTMKLINLEIQENTFHYVSREIHDNISLSLTLIKLQLNTIDFVSKSKTKMQVKTASDLLGTSIDSLRDLSKSFNTDIVESFGLLKALENEIERVRAANLFEIILSINGEIVYLDSKHELILFRIIQESLNNIIKHSGAKKAEVSLNYEEKFLNLTVTDNGRGFRDSDENEEKHSGKAGLRNMRSRIEMIGGTMHIQNSQPSGSQLIFQIPIEDESNN